MANRPVSFVTYGDENFDEMLKNEAATIQRRTNIVLNESHPCITNSHLLYKFAETNMNQWWISNRRYDRWNSVNEYLVNILITPNTESFWYAEDQIRTLSKPTRTNVSDKLTRFNLILRTLGIQQEKDADYSYLTIPDTFLPEFFLKDTQNYKESGEMVINTLRGEENYAQEREEKG